MEESRTDLLAWLNNLLQINYTEVEQCGTGAAYCQIIDSVYGDLPMTRVKMNAKREYEYLVNYKVLQNVFKAKKIDKPIPVEKLTKCKMQDNLDFLQWIKNFWDANYGGQGYDPVERRKGQPTDTPATVAPIATGRTTTGGGLRVAAGRAGGRAPSGQKAGSTQPNEATEDQEATEFEELVPSYLLKLRDIETIVQQRLAVIVTGGSANEYETLLEIEKILYSTEGEDSPSEEETL